jgi:hypothetical protein
VTVYRCYSMILQLMVLITTALVGCALVARNPVQVTYGVAVTCLQGQTLVFPDFNLGFVGTRRETLPQYPRGFLYYDYNITSGGQKQTVAWTSGTGAIGPQVFQVDGENFTLERVFSDKLGKLGEDDIVIWKGDVAK